ncbi:unnamed protein product [Allacma fusca]|uniref:Uncharacterized protein n=1 Tax=Allacma fusca TaxID=39272 RepID=A0A8J2LDR8_9HEXA|nr:unnamed protein product [Allacma fusca]
MEFSELAAVRRKLFKFIPKVGGAEQQYSQRTLGDPGGPDNSSSEFSEEDSDAERGDQEGGREGNTPPPNRHPPPPFPSGNGPPDELMAAQATH